MVDRVNNFTQGTNIYPKNMNKSYDQVVNDKALSVPPSTRHNNNPSPVLSSDSELDEESEDEVVFARDAKNIRCFYCKELGHYKGSI